MTHPAVSPETARFLRTLRVATATTLAAADLAGALRARSSTSFLALAAKGRDDWRFPADGLISADGLVRASLSEAGGGRSLTLQALGAAGLTRYAGRGIRLTLASGLEISGPFDRDGQLSILLAGDLAESELAGFDVEILDDTP